MFRWIGVLLALVLVAWLAAKQMDTAGSGASKAAAEAARTAGVESVVIDEDTPPPKVAEQVGAQVDAMVQASKARVDEAESASQ